MESVRTFANQTVTVSFWAKAASGTPKIAPELFQYFGAGGSPSASVSTPGTQVTLSTSWARYSSTITVPSISGKTLGTAGDFLQLSLWVSAGTTFNARSGSLGIQSNTFDVWGVQVEAGSTATDFQTATGSYGGELALCQRYYWRNSNSGNSYASYFTAMANTSTRASSVLNFPVPMRIAPTTVEYANICFENYATSQYALSAVVLSSATNTTMSARLEGTISGAVAGHAGYINAQNSTSAYLAVSAEL
jgi:hypothetical protein